MGMIGCFQTTSDSDIDALIASPKRIELLLYGKYVSDEGKNKGIFSFLKPKKEEVVDNWEPEDKGEGFDIDKAWHGIHFLLTGFAWAGSGPEAFIIVGGTQIGEIDVGYGPARAFKSNEVAAIADKLRDINKEKLRKGYDKQAFSDNEIYPEIWDEDPEECFGYFWEYFENLKQFINKTAENKKALIVYIG